LDRAISWPYRDGEGALIEVAPDRGYTRTLIERERDLWRHVLEDPRPQPRRFEW